MAFDSVHPSRYEKLHLCPSTRSATPRGPKDIPASVHPTCSAKAGRINNTTSIPLHIVTKASQEKTKRCLFIHFVLTERSKICSFLSPHAEHLPGDFPPCPPNKTEFCRLNCNTRSFHQVEAQSQSLPPLPGLMPCRAGTGTEVRGSFSYSLLGKLHSVKGSSLRCSRCLCLLVTG